MKGFMTIVVLLSGALIGFGCKASNEAPSDPPPSEVTDTADTKTDTETSAEPEESQETTAEPDESESVDDEAARKAALVERVKGLTQVKNVVHGDEGIRLVYVLEGNPKVNQESKPKVVTDAMLFAEFFTASMLYSRLRDLDGLEQSFVFKRERIGTIRTTRQSFESLGYAEAMQGATDDESKQRVFRELLERLPREDVEIDKRYRP